MSNIQINFDSANQPEQPLFVLAKRNGEKLGALEVHELVISDDLNNANELSFKIYKYEDDTLNSMWKELTDLRLIYVPEWDMWFELSVDINDGEELVKNVSCKGVTESELSQIMLYDIEINTEVDIARDDYAVTKFYDATMPEASLIHRILKDKAQHYTVVHVDDTLKDIQRTFKINDKSIYDFLNKTLSEEIGCLVIFGNGTNSNGVCERTLSFYDTRANCNQCGFRGDYTAVCPKCGSTDINEGYGNDTTIFIESYELSDNIRVAANVDSVKNVFRLQAGDDLMTATVRNINPSGSNYLWSIGEFMLKDMSQGLRSRITEYNSLFASYRDDVIYNTDEGLRTKYASIVGKYKPMNEELFDIPSTIKGYEALIQSYYNTVNLEWWLKSGMMPSLKSEGITKEQQIALLTNANLSPVSVYDIGRLTQTSADSAVLSMARILIDTSYKVTIESSSLQGTNWTGSFIIENYSDEADKTNSGNVTVAINSDYGTYIKQKVSKIIDKQSEKYSKAGIEYLFKLSDTNFKAELRKYGISGLKVFMEATQSILDILVEQGISNENAWKSNTPNLYVDIYYPYYKKLEYINSELMIREGELATVIGVYNNNILVKDGMQTLIKKHVLAVQNTLDFEKFLGRDLLNEFNLFRREDEYSNDNFISDGLNDVDLFKRANEFLNEARNELYKASSLQFVLTSTLKNILAMPKFNPIKDYFKVGNWLRFRVDGQIYKLRLLKYEIDYTNLENLEVEFSDVFTTSGGISDAISLMSRVKSMATEYESINKQVSQGKLITKVVNEWREKGLDATNTKIIGGADNQSQIWDEHGMVFKRYDDTLGDFTPEQLKIINSTIAITNDNWRTTKTAIGNFYYVDPLTGALISAYGVNGETIVGKLLLGEALGIYNQSNTMTVDERGFITSNGSNTIKIDPNTNAALLEISNAIEKTLYTDDKGDLHVKGEITATGLNITSNIAKQLVMEVVNSESFANEINAITPYTHFAYADSADGKTGFSTTDAVGKTYIGIYTDNSSVDSTNPDKYTWSLIKGADGIQLFTWVKYADTPTSGMSDSPTGKKYMGIAHNKTTSVESTNYADYEWSLIVGADGTGITGVTNYYLASPNSTGVTTATAGWVTTVPTLTETNKYLWNYEKVSYSNSTSTSTTPAVIGTFVKDGTNGRGITKIEEFYLVSAVNTGITTSTSGWETTPPLTTETNKFLWNYEKITYTDNTIFVSQPAVIGTHGAKGEQGIQGADGVSTYVWLKYADSPTTGMSDAPDGKKYIGIATNKTTPTESNSYGDYTWSLIQGAAGIPGTNGVDGKTYYVWIKYADDNNGTNMSDAPDGKRYIGIAVNQTSPTKSTNPALYAWSPLFDNVRVGGTNLIKDSGTPVTNSEYTIKTYKWGDINNCIGGEEYTVTVWGKLDTSNAGWYMNNSQRKVADNTILYPAMVTMGASDKIAEGVYRKTFKMPTLPEGYVWHNATLLYAHPLKAPPKPANTVYKIKLERGNVGTDWSPAPEDVASSANEEILLQHMQKAKQVIENTSITQIVADTKTYSDRMSAINMSLAGSGVNLFGIFTMDAKSTPNTVSSGMIDITYNLEPNTQYTISTDRSKVAGSCDIFVSTKPNTAASTPVNGISKDAPRTIVTTETGVLVVTLRNAAVRDDIVLGNTHIKIDKGAIMTPWSPAPEDVADNGTVKAALQSLTGDGLITTVVNNQKFTDYINGVETRVVERAKGEFANTAEGFYGSYEQIVQGLNGSVETIVNRIQFDGANKTLSIVPDPNESSMSMELSNNKLAFKDGAIEVASVSDKQLTITNAVISNNLSFANHKSYKIGDKITAFEWIGK